MTTPDYITGEQTLTLLGYIAPGWQIIQPLSIRLEPDDEGGYIISDNIFTVYGTGDTPLAAHHDYVACLLEYHQLLQDRAVDETSRAWFAKLQSYLQPTAD